MARRKRPDISALVNAVGEVAGPAFKPDRVRVLKAMRYAGEQAVPAANKGYSTLNAGVSEWLQGTEQPLTEEERIAITIGALTVALRSLYGLKD